ncbi:uncharacterized protein LOC141853579 isoform X2 [Brevipalpus obovatus]|uniref:uncharacterized protein LOC141853579 isoform X2 n=1 Tax=Brevipalpus obovatus TaxID=246614 RepID=UPI003D9DC96F
MPKSFLLSKKRRHSKLTPEILLQSIESSTSSSNQENSNHPSTSISNSQETTNRPDHSCQQSEMFEEMKFLHIHRNMGIMASSHNGKKIPPVSIDFDPQTIKTESIARDSSVTAQNFINLESYHSNSNACGSAQSQPIPALNPHHGHTSGNFSVQAYQKAQDEPQDLRIAERKNMDMDSSHHQNMKHSPISSPEYANSPISLGSISVDEMNSRESQENSSGYYSPGSLDEEYKKIVVKTKRASKNSSANRAPSKCNFCSKILSNSSNLARHRQIHGKNELKCSECPKSYFCQPSLSMHLKTHKDPHTCLTCGKKFSRPWLLKGHNRTHTGERPFDCHICGKAFADKSNLRAHIQTHSKVKPYKCERCGKRFALKSYLGKHEMSSCMKFRPNPSTSNTSNNRNQPMYIAPASTSAPILVSEITVS